MTWAVRYLPEAEKDLRDLSRDRQKLVLKAIKKVKENPLPSTEGGYGKPLGNSKGIKLSGFLKVKLRGEGLRIVYRLKRLESTMLIVIIGIRDDSTVYKEAQKRIIKNDL